SRREPVIAEVMASTVESQTRRSPKPAVPDESHRSPTTASEFYSLLDAVDSESTAEQFDIGTYNEKHDFDNHLRIGAFEGINPSGSLAELAEKSILMIRWRIWPPQPSRGGRTTATTARSFACCSDSFTLRSCTISVAFNASVWSRLTVPSS